MKSQTLHTLDLLVSKTNETKASRASVRPQPSKISQYLKSTEGHNIGLAAFTK